MLRRGRVALAVEAKLPKPAKFTAGADPIAPLVQQRFDVHGGPSWLVGYADGLAELDEATGAVLGTVDAAPASSGPCWSPRTRSGCGRGTTSCARSIRGPGPCWRSTRPRNGAAGCSTN